jgi:hypothetical protein
MWILFQYIILIIIDLRNYISYNTQNSYNAIKTKITPKVKLKTKPLDALFLPK